MANRSERQLHESAKGVDETFSTPERNDGPAVGGYKSITFYRKRTHSVCYLLGMGNLLQSFKLALMELQVKELQKADVKACCLHDESKNEKQLMEGKYSVVCGAPEVALS